jgi:hypothetical protein
MKIDIKISIEAFAEADVHFLKYKAKLRARIRRCLKEFPDKCEGSIMLDGVEYWFVYVVEDGVAGVKMAPRYLAEAILSEQGLTTHEPFNPLSELERKRAAALSSKGR